MSETRHFFCIGWRPSGAQKPLVYYEALYEERHEAEEIVNDMQRHDPSHVFFVDVPANICMCPKCKGSGTRGKHACNHCHGIGLVGA